MPDFYLNYFAIFIFIIFALALASLLIFLPKLFAKKYNKTNAESKEQLSSYECGFEPFANAREKFDVRFYLVAILFIIFDLEIAFLIPWALTVKKIGVVSFVSMMIFLSVLIIGFIYEWKKGALDWI